MIAVFKKSNVNCHQFVCVKYLKSFSEKNMLKNPKPENYAFFPLILPKTIFPGQINNHFILSNQPNRFPCLLIIFLFVIRFRFKFFSPGIRSINQKMTFQIVYYFRGLENISKAMLMVMINKGFFEALHPKNKSTLTIKPPISKI